MMMDWMMLDHSEELPKIGAILERERASAGRIIHLDSGDFFQGAIVFNEYAGKAEVELLSEIGLGCGGCCQPRVRQRCQKSSGPVWWIWWLSTACRQLRL